MENDKATDRLKMMLLEFDRRVRRAMELAESETIQAEVCTVDGGVKYTLVRVNSEKKY